MCIPHINLSNTQALTKPITIHLPNFQVAIVRQIGFYFINKNLTLHNVLSILDFNVKLISVTKLTKQLQYSFSFYHDHCLIHDSRMKIISMGKKQNDLYLLQVGKNDSSFATSVRHVFTTNSSSFIWHKARASIPT